MATSGTNQATSTRKLSSDFWTFWTGQTISNLGSSITLFALPLLVYKLTGSALNLGIAEAATFLPYLLFGLVLGAWVDRVDRKRPWNAEKSDECAPSEAADDCAGRRNGLALLKRPIQFFR